MLRGSFSQWNSWCKWCKLNKVSIRCWGDPFPNGTRDVNDVSWIKPQLDAEGIPFPIETGYCNLTSPVSIRCWKGSLSSASNWWCNFTQLTSPVRCWGKGSLSASNWDFTQLTSPVLLGKGSPQHLIETLLNLHHQFYWERDPSASNWAFTQLNITSSIGKGIPSASNWNFAQLTSPVLLGKGSPQHLIGTLLNLHHQFY